MPLYTWEEEEAEEAEEAGIENMSPWETEDKRQENNFATINF